MDDRRFDQLVKAVASGASRRSVLKGMLGLGGAALVGGAALEPGAKAARRPTPTPKPITCPGNQTPVNGVCTCPGSAPNKCGPDCCTGKVTDPYPRAANHSECCDNACCFGTCYGEELCCPTNSRSGELPPLADVCSATNECCLAPDFCCNIDGCCSTVCWGGDFDDDFCCPAEDLCPGGGTSPDLCCTGDTTCCGAGTDDNTCIDLTLDDACCIASDCGPPAEGTCGWDCSGNVCVSFVCVEGTICCEGACVSSSEFGACPVDPEGCCSTADGFICCGTDGCCLSTRCNEINGDCCASEAAVCRVEGGCCTPPQECCLGETCCDPGKCTTGGACCTGDDIVCAGECCPEERCSPGVGCCPDGFLGCSGGICCRAEVYQCSTTGPGCECLPGTEACGLLPGGCCPEGQCNDVSGECCDPGTSPCGSTCCDDGQCNEDFFCCSANTTACGEDCCIDGTETCNVASGACECAGNAILCNGVCTLNECCAGENPADHCQSIYGYDLNCVYCPTGFCDTSPFNGALCETDDTKVLGKCDDGFCIPCGGGTNAPCEFDDDCCSGICQDNGQCTDP
jgi:hypothetical protein